jgi:hypothetical protein
MFPARQLLFHGVAVKTRFFYALACAFLVLAPQPAAAQFDAVTALFKEVHSITLYGQGTYIKDPLLKGESECGFLSGTLCGVGTEVLIDVGDSEGMHVELGLGASYLRGLTDKSGDYDFNAGIRSFPTISAYLVEIPFWPTAGLEAYTGASIGLIELQNGQMYDTAGVERGVGGSTFEFGGTIGLYKQAFPGIGVFTEASQRWRRFSSLNYEASAGNDDKVPTTWPRELDLSGFTLAAGLQFRLKAEEAQSVPMLWTLARVDAQPLPAVVQAVPGGNGSVIHSEVVFGMLRLVPDTVHGVPDATRGKYVLDLHSRQVTRTASGEIQAIVEPALLPSTASAASGAAPAVVPPAASPPVLKQERGRYVISAGKLDFDPDGDTVTAYPAIHLGDDEIRIRHSASGYGLVFQKPGAAPAPKKEEDDDS